MLFLDAGDIFTIADSCRGLPAWAHHNAGLTRLAGLPSVQVYPDNRLDADAARGLVRRERVVL